MSQIADFEIVCNCVAYVTGIVDKLDTLLTLLAMYWGREKENHDEREQHHH